MAILALLALPGCAASRQAQDPPASPRSAPDQYRLIASPGVVLPDGRRGGGVYLHRIEASSRGREVTLWSRYLWEFSGLLFNRRARIAVLGDRVLVHTQEGRFYLACDRDSGERPVLLQPGDPMISEAESAWRDARIEDRPEVPYAPQRTWVE